MCGQQIVTRVLYNFRGDAPLWGSFFLLEITGHLHLFFRHCFERLPASAGDCRLAPAPRALIKLSAPHLNKKSPLQIL